MKRGAKRDRDDVTARSRRADTMTSLVSLSRFTVYSLTAHAHSRIRNVALAATA